MTMDGYGLENLTETERDAILNVIQRDEGIRKKDLDRIKKLKAEVKQLRLKGVIKEGQDADKSCARCRQPFGWLFNKGALCPNCQHKVCDKCRETVEQGSWLCVLCVKQMQLEAMSGTWFLKKFRKSKRNRKTNQVMGGSELVRTSFRRSPRLSSSSGTQVAGNSITEEVKRALSNNNAAPPRSPQSNRSSDRENSDTQSMGGNSPRRSRDLYEPAAFPQAEDKQLLMELIRPRRSGGNSPIMEERVVEVKKISSHRYRDDSSSDDSAPSSPRLSSRNDHSDSLRSSVRSSIVSSEGRMTIVTDIGGVSDIEMASIGPSTPTGSPYLDKRPSPSGGRLYVTDSTQRTRSRSPTPERASNHVGHGNRAVAKGGAALALKTAYDRDMDSSASSDSSECAKDGLTRIKFKRVSAKNSRSRSPSPDPKTISARSKNSKNDSPSTTLAHAGAPSVSINPNSSTFKLKGPTVDTQTRRNVDTDDAEVASIMQHADTGCIHDELISALYANNNTTKITDKNSGTGDHAPVPFSPDDKRSAADIIRYKLGSLVARIPGLNSANGSSGGGGGDESLHPLPLDEEEHNTLHAAQASPRQSQAGTHPSFAQKSLAVSKVSSTTDPWDPHDGQPPLRHSRKYADPEMLVIDYQDGEGQTAKEVRFGEYRNTEHSYSQNWESLETRSEGSSSALMGDDEDSDDPQNSSFENLEWDLDALTTPGESGRGLSEETLAQLRAALLENLLSEPAVINEQQLRQEQEEAPPVPGRRSPLYDNELGPISNVDGDDLLDHVDRGDFLDRGEGEGFGPTSEEYQAYVEAALASLRMTRYGRILPPTDDDDDADSLSVISEQTEPEERGGNSSEETVKNEEHLLGDSDLDSCMLSWDEVIRKHGSADEALTYAEKQHLLLAQLAMESENMPAHSVQKDDQAAAEDAKNNDHPVRRQNGEQQQKAHFPAANKSNSPPGHETSERSQRPPKRPPPFVRMDTVELLAVNQPEKEVPVSDLDDDLDTILENNRKFITDEEYQDIMTSLCATETTPKATWQPQDLNVDRRYSTNQSLPVIPQDKPEKLRSSAPQTKPGGNFTQAESEGADSPVDSSSVPSVALLQRFFDTPARSRSPSFRDNEDSPSWSESDPNTPTANPGKDISELTSQTSLATSCVAQIQMQLLHPECQKDAGRVDISKSGTVPTITITEYDACDGQGRRGDSPDTALLREGDKHGGRDPVCTRKSVQETTNADSLRHSPTQRDTAVSVVMSPQEGKASAMSAVSTLMAEENDDSMLGTMEEPQSNSRTISGPVESQVAVEKTNKAFSKPDMGRRFELTDEQPCATVGSSLEAPMETVIPMPGIDTETSTLSKSIVDVQGVNDKTSATCQDRDLSVVTKLQPSGEWEEKMADTQFSIAPYSDKNADSTNDPPQTRSSTNVARGKRVESLDKLEEHQHMLTEDDDDDDDDDYESYSDLPSKTTSKPTTVESLPSEDDYTAAVESQDHVVAQAAGFVFAKHRVSSGSEPEGHHGADAAKRPASTEPEGASHRKAIRVEGKDKDCLSFLEMKSEHVQQSPDNGASVMTLISTGTGTDANGVGIISVGTSSQVPAMHRSAGVGTDPDSPQNDRNATVGNPVDALAISTAVIYVKEKETAGRIETADVAVGTGDLVENVSSGSSSSSSVDEYTERRRSRAFPRSSSYEDVYQTSFNGVGDITFDDGGPLISADQAYYPVFSNPPGRMTSPSSREADFELLSPLKSRPHDAVTIETRTPNQASRDSPKSSEQFLERWVFVGEKFYPEVYKSTKPESEAALKHVDSWASYGTAGSSDDGHSHYSSRSSTLDQTWASPPYKDIDRLDSETDDLSEKDDSRPTFHDEDDYDEEDDDDDDEDGDDEMQESGCNATVSEDSVSVTDLESEEDESHGNFKEILSTNGRSFDSLDVFIDDYSDTAEERADPDKLEEDFTLSLDLGPRRDHFDHGHNRSAPSHHHGVGEGASSNDNIQSRDVAVGVGAAYSQLSKREALGPDSEEVMGEASVTDLHSKHDDNISLAVHDQRQIDRLSSQGRVPNAVQSRYDGGDGLVADVCPKHTVPAMLRSRYGGLEIFPPTYEQSPQESGDDIARDMKGSTQDATVPATATQVPGNPQLLSSSSSISSSSSRSNPARPNTLPVSPVYNGSGNLTHHTTHLDNLSNTTEILQKPLLVRGPDAELSPTSVSSYIQAPLTTKPSGNPGSQIHAGVKHVVDDPTEIANSGGGTSEASLTHSGDQSFALEEQLVQGTVCGHLSSLDASYHHEPSPIGEEDMAASRSLHLDEHQPLGRRQLTATPPSGTDQHQTSSPEEEYTTPMTAIPEQLAHMAPLEQTCYSSEELCPSPTPSHESSHHNDTSTTVSVHSETASVHSELPPGGDKQRHEAGQGENGVGVRTSTTSQVPSISVTDSGAEEEEEEGTQEDGRAAAAATAAAAAAAAGKGAGAKDAADRFSAEEENLDDACHSHASMMSDTSAISINSQRSNLLTPFSASRESISSFYSDAGEGNYGKFPVTGEILFGLDYKYKTSMFEVHIKQCKDLAAVDTKRKRSDPYIKTYLLPDKTKSGKRKTRVKKHTLSPTFDEVLKYQMTKSELENRTLWLTVWHNDTFGRNDFLGEVNIPLDNYSFNDHAPKWHKLMERSLLRSSPKGQSMSMLWYKGDLALMLKLVSAEQVLTKKKGKGKGELQVTVKQARNLTAVRSSGTSDPFCKAYLLPDKGKHAKQKTAVVKKNCNPTWNHTFVFEEVSWDDLRDRSLELTVWDHDRFTSNDFLGGARLSQGTGKCNGKDVDWMDSVGEEVSLWQGMLDRPNCWVEGTLPLRPNMDKRNT